MARLVHRISAGLALAGGVLVLMGALLTSVSVVLRWLTASGIGGDVELVQMGLVVAVFAFLPLCLVRGGNIMVDTFTSRAPATLRAGLDSLWALVYAAVAGLIAWMTTQGAIEAFAYNSTTMVLGLEIGWPMALSALFAAWLALTALIVAIGYWRERGA